MARHISKVAPTFHLWAFIAPDSDPGERIQGWDPPLVGPTKRALWILGFCEADCALRGMIRALGSEPRFMEGPDEHHVEAGDESGPSKQDKSV
ncbi:hypothetical protein L484_006605 [Morus notabilis]|uniref:Uncharacterized protein n=1 Tax=Morus notabilis TaxID=981085 RepID=W9S3A0_9ROSA|nr:hypothetical protein L484_006605 [Morus notabilis]